MVPYVGPVCLYVQTEGQKEWKSSCVLLYQSQQYFQYTQSNISHNNVMSLLFFKLFAHFMLCECFACLHVCVYTTSMQYSGRPEDSCGSLTTGVAEGCEPPCGLLRLNSVCLQKQQVFLMMEISLQPCLLLLMKKNIRSLEIISIWLIYSMSIHVCNLFLIVFIFFFLWVGDYGVGSRSKRGRRYRKEYKLSCKFPFLKHSFLLSFFHPS